MAVVDLLSFGASFLAFLAVGFAERFEIGCLEPGLSLSVSLTAAPSASLKTLFKCSCFKSPLFNWSISSTVSRTKRPLTMLMSLCKTTLRTSRAIFLFSCSSSSLDITSYIADHQPISNDVGLTSQYSANL